MKSRHTWQRLSLGWKVSNELRVNWKASCSLRLVLSVQLMRINSKVSHVPRCGNNNLVFPCFPSPLREAVSFCLCERQCLIDLCERQCLVDLCERQCCFPVSCFQYACAISPFCLFLGWLMHASHMLSHRICSGPLTTLLLHDSANENSMFHRD